MANMQGSFNDGKQTFSFPFKYQRQPPNSFRTVICAAEQCVVPPKSQMQIPIDNPVIKRAGSFQFAGYPTTGNDGHMFVQPVSGVMNSMCSWILVANAGDVSVTIDQGEHVGYLEPLDDRDTISGVIFNVDLGPANVGGEQQLEFLNPHDEVEKREFLGFPNGEVQQHNGFQFGKGAPQVMIDTVLHFPQVFTTGRPGQV